MKAGAVLIVTACERGRGGGHLNRSLFLVKSLREKGRAAYLWIPEDVKKDTCQRFGEFFEGLESPHTVVLSQKEDLLDKVWDFIILDRFKTSAEEFAFWYSLPGRNGVPLIGIDEGGPCRKQFDFLIDLLPGLSEHKPNLNAPCLLSLPKNRLPKKRRTATGCNEGEAGPLRVLISFGAEDSARLGYSAALTLSSRFSFLFPHFSLPEITLIDPAFNQGGNSKMQRKLPGVSIIGKMPDLRERLAEYDFFITHFGLGAFEAVYARVPVLLVSPTAYHEKLAKKAGFYTVSPHFNTSPISLSALRSLREEIARRYNLEEDQKEDLGFFINSLAPNSFRNCPVCNKPLGTQSTTKTMASPAADLFAPVIARFPEESFCRCPYCGVVYLSRLKPPPVEYEKEYFFGSYKKQYGKTYLEDFPNLKEIGRRRIEKIKMVYRAETQRREEKKNELDAKPVLLDIGCAYGPFLAAAAEAGFVPYGIEPAEDAVRYVNEELRFTAWHGFFPDDMPGASLSSSSGNVPIQFDIITLWYVIEHFKEPGKVLLEISRLLKAGGILAFSTPSLSGISGRRQLHSFLKNSPGDHWTIWSPGICKRILKQYGFKLCKITVTGHHPERFPLLGRFVQTGNKGPLYRLLLLVSRFFRLGDTFEVYAAKY